MKTNREVMVEDIKRAWWSGQGVLGALTEQELHKIWSVVMIALPRLEDPGDKEEGLD